MSSPVIVIVAQPIHLGTRLIHRSRVIVLDCYFEVEKRLGVWRLTGTVLWLRTPAANVSVLSHVAVNHHDGDPANANGYIERGV